MIIEHKKIELFGEKVFEKVVASKTLKNPNPLPNEGCFFYVIEGSNQSISETQNITLQANEGVLMKCGNYIYKATPDNSSNRLAFVAIHLYPHIIKRVFSNNASSLLINKAETNKHLNMAAVKNNPFLSNYMQGILHYFKYLNTANESLLELKFKEFLLLMQHSEKSRDIQQIIHNLFNPNEVAFKDVVKAHLFSDITVSDLAALTNCSVATFKRKFTSYYQDSPAHYIMNKRLEKSAELLRFSDESISHIAYDCQFKNAAHFATAFKKKYKLSPAEYRKSHSRK